MSYYPGCNCHAEFKRDKLVWKGQDGTECELPWSAIRLVTTCDQGATVHLAKTSVLVSNSIVWYEFVVEDIIEKARQANPKYEGPTPTPKPRALQIPGSHQDQLNYTRRAQRFYKTRCPNYQEFKAFLEANQQWDFDESSFDECSMSMCSGSPVREGYSTDLVIPPGQKWYFEFEKKTGSGHFSGSQLLDILRTILP